LVSNGLINEEPLKELLPIIDAANIDIKGFTEEFYKKVTKFAGLKYIKQNVLTMWKEGVHIELTMLLIPGYNDNPEEVKTFTSWILEKMDDRVPVHFSRFYPHYKMQNVPPTPVETILKAKSLAEEMGLRYVYTGNLPYSEINTTFCQNCGATLVERVYYNVKIKELTKKNQCRKCGYKADFVI
ncbi:MAG: AmmeMemoRadiSam system radical SAM enzyme, partial [Candidatus Heimdallarchaeaceae archaeon]